MVLETSLNSKNPFPPGSAGTFPGNYEHRLHSALGSWWGTDLPQIPAGSGSWDSSAAPTMEAGEFQQLSSSEIEASSWQYQGRNKLCCPWAPIEKKKKPKNLSRIDMWHLKCPQNLIVSINILPSPDWIYIPSQCNALLFFFKRQLDQSDEKLDSVCLEMI